MNAKYSELEDEIPETKKQQIKEKIKDFFILHFHLYGVGRQTMRAFTDALNPYLLFNIIMSLIATGLCIKYDIQFDFPYRTFIPIISLLLAFLINIDFDRRESALGNIAEFKANCLSLYLMAREWKKVTGVDDQVFFNISNKITLLCIHMREYLQTTEKDKRKFLAKVMYENIGDLHSNLIVYSTQKENYLSLTAVFIGKAHDGILRNFEKLRVYREYRSTYSALSFLKVTTCIWPVLFAPSFVYMASEISHTSSYTSYFLSIMITFIYNQLQGVEDLLFDPFLGISQDDIKLDDIEIWIQQAIRNISFRTLEEVDGKLIFRKPHFDESSRQSTVNLRRNEVKYSRLDNRIIL